MRKKLCLLILIALMLTIVPVITYAAESRTPDVSGAASSVNFNNTSLEVYPAATIDMENPEYNLCRVVVNFRTAQNASVYKQFGDTVSFFIKSSRDAEIAWVDKNANNDYEKGEELDPVVLGSANGAYVKDARLTKGGTVIFYIGSQLPGDFNVMVYTDQGGEPGYLIGSQAPGVKQGSGTVILTPTDYKGLYNLSGTGSSSKPYVAVAGTDIVLRTKARSGNYPLVEKKVTYKMYSKAGGYVEIGTAETDDEGIAFLDFETEKAGLHSFQAFVNGQQSEEVYINFLPDKAGMVEAKTEDDTILPQKVITKIEFYVKDDYGNIIDSKGQDIVEFSIVDEPEGSKYFGYSGQTAPSNQDGLAVFNFEPDLIGEYSIRCKLIGDREADTIDVEAVYFGEVTDISAALKNGEAVIPSVKYTDANNDGVPEKAGRLEIRMANKIGAAKIASGYELYSLDFAVSNGEAVFIDGDGSITVKDETFKGTVPVTIYDKKNQVSTIFNLKIVGPPVALKQNAEIEGKKAKVSIQYVDTDGNDSYGNNDEEYTIVLPAGVSATEIEDIDQSGKATFVLNAAEYKKYDISVMTKDTKLAKNFSVKFEPLAADKEIIGARKIVMFLGIKNYSQDNLGKISDVAPFIKEGRTFVAIRPVAEAFGAEIGWDQSSQTVTLTRADLVVKIVIGSNSISVVKDGEAAVIPADVPAFIQDGRTVLPFRAVGDAFGATVSYDSATQAVSYTQ